MSDYYGTYGQKVQYLSSDPSPVQIGQVWYNSTSATLKVRSFGTINAWASGGNYPTAIQGMMGAGIYTAALAMGGYTGGSPIVSNVTSTYNGSAWTTVPATMNTARQSATSVGTQTAALISGGGTATITITNSESYNGTSWTNTPSLSTARLYVGSAGIQTAALTIGGNASGPGINTSTSAVESWNGTTWTGAPSLNNAAGYNVGNGLQTAAITYGGYNWGTSTVLSVTELYNGTSWTNTTSMPAVRYAHGGSGTQTSVISYGGTSNSVALWNGSTWTNTTNMGTTRNAPTKQIGTGNNAVAVGGDAGAGNVASTEQFTGTGAQTKTVTVS